MNLLVVDMQNDFISGTLACPNALEILKKVVDFIKNFDGNVYYSLDWHESDHCSFIQNGGIWPIHCVAESFGASLDNEFYTKLPAQKSPNADNMFFKGMLKEQYSAFKATNKDSVFLSDIINNNVLIVGIALEYCVLQTAIDFKKAGFDVKVDLNLCACVNKSKVDDVIFKFKNEGIKFNT
ncbi:isochorismatase family protein [Campylobacter pinnipediorum]|uniref:isochorismatase family protein n=1 Tax=Campylobacter pinnipediorum TaxID=1965231 RepID=UPI00084CF9DE|nr:isochorismatase family protein [Campylobacter pinnipediorum]